jgi:hypothetical protein
MQVIALPEISVLSPRFLQLSHHFREDSCMISGYEGFRPVIRFSLGHCPSAEQHLPGYL